MLSKLVIMGAMSTGLIGTTLPPLNIAEQPMVKTVIPTGFELSAGPLRLESGHGSFFNAHLDAHSRFTIRIELSDNRSVLLKL